MAQAIVAYALIIIGAAVGNPAIIWLSVLLGITGIITYILKGDII